MSLKERISKVVDNSWFGWGLLIMVIATALIPFIGSMIKSRVDCDSAHYICMAQRIAEGYIPYKTLALDYTPLFMYLMAGYKLLFGIPNGCFWPYLLLHYFLEFGVSYFVYAIAREFGSSKKVAVVGGWLTFMMIHWLNGNCVLLEVPSLFFGLLSTLCLLRFRDKNIWHLLWIGALTTCAFLSKQYGLGFIGINLVVLFAINRQSWKEVCIFLLGFALPIMACFVYWGKDFLPVIFNDYGTKTAVEAGQDVSVAHKLHNMASGLLCFCRVACKAVFVGLLSFPQALKCGHFWKLLLGYCGIVGFSLQFIFAGVFLHYMIYMVPFACLTLTEMLTIQNGRWLQILKYIAVIYVAAVTFKAVYIYHVYWQYIVGNEREEQYSFSKEVKKYIRPGETLWVVDTNLYYLLFTADVMPPNLSTVGYSFGPLGLNEREAFNQAKEADWVIRSSEDYKYETFFTDSLKHVVERYPLISQFSDSTSLLYKNPNKRQLLIYHSTNHTSLAKRCIICSKLFIMGSCPVMAVIPKIVNSFFKTDMVSESVCSQHQGRMPWRCVLCFAT